MYHEISKTNPIIYMDRYFSSDTGTAAIREQKQTLAEYNPFQKRICVHKSQQEVTKSIKQEV